MMHFKTLSLSNNTFIFTVMSSPYITTICSECILLIVSLLMLTIVHFNIAESSKCTRDT